jgi:hypothetical protein
MFDIQHEADMAIVANWLIPDLYPKESEDEIFISQMAYQYRKIIDNIPEEDRELCNNMEDAYDATKKFYC